MRRLRTVVVFALVLGTGVFAPPSAPPVTAAAGPQQVLAVVNLFSSLLSRNRVYRNAAEVQDDVRAYYDGLRDTARAALRDRDLSTLDNQLAAYVRFVATLEYEKNAALQLLEDDKRGAHQAFQSDVNRNAPSLLIALPGARDVAQALRTDLGELRDVLRTSRAAIAAGRSDVVLDIAGRRAQLDQIAVVASIVGGRPGRDLTAAVGAVDAELQRVQRASGSAADEVDSGLEEAERELSGVLARFDQLTETEVRPASVSLFGGLRQVRIPGRYAYFAAIAQALSAPGSRIHGLTRDAMRDRVRQYLVETRGAALAALRDCFIANAAQLRSQLAGADAPEGSAAALLLSTDLSTCDPQAVAAVLAAAAEMDVPATSAPEETPPASDDPGTPPATSGDESPPATDDTSWSVGWGDPTSAAARQYLVSTSNVMTTVEGPVTYWHPSVGAELEQDAPVGMLVYHIPLPGPIAGGEIRLTTATFHWDYSSGSAAVDGSTDGTTWQVLDEIGPPAWGAANVGGLSGPLPELFAGSDEIWLRVRLAAWGPQAADGAPWTNTSQHGRWDVTTGNDTFTLRVDLAP